MNLYHKKQRWKLALLGGAILMVAASLWFSSRIVQRVQEKEVNRVQQWADAVKRKSELVNLTNNAFNELSLALEELSESEEKIVEIWSQAVEQLNRPLGDFTFIMNIMVQNDEIPIILTNENEHPELHNNMGYLDDQINEVIRRDYVHVAPESKDSLFSKIKEDSLVSFVQQWKQKRPPIQIDVDGEAPQLLFYYDRVSIKRERLKMLQQSRDSLTEAFTNELIENEDLVPVLFIDKQTREVIATNIEDYDSTNTNELVRRLAAQNDSISVKLSEENEGVIYFEYSAEITQMKYFPFVQFFIIGLFVLIAYLVFSTFRKAEQDQVWVGMAKETAHQLGTPISSLMAWNELLQAQGVDAMVTEEIDKDIQRLSTVTNRFSKIGSEAILSEENVVEILVKTIAYLQKRISSKIDLTFEPSQEVLMAMVNRSLLEWVIENITKNAVDAMEGAGKIAITATQVEDEIQIDISDTGKGIPGNKIKTVFQPGYTTKKRGWGLGLSLVKRIVEDFHKGKVFVLKSEVGVGTTFRIILKV